MDEELSRLASELRGELYWDEKMRLLYATDASAYRELPLAVAIPRDLEDLRLLIFFASAHGISLIPRAAGTSLAGQVVGSGIVVDISRYFTEILELNAEECWVRVQPGVIRDELNRYLANYDLYFGPETSTANRAMIGGMVGNNSCGSNSLIYGSTREHTLEIKALLSDGTESVFKSLDFDDFIKKGAQDNLEGAIYRQIRQMLSDYTNQQHIHHEFPKSSIPRRNTGYAIDLLLEANPFTAGGPPFNFCKLLCGSEGTLAFVTEVKLKVVPRRKQPTGLLCVHFHSIQEALQANLIVLQHDPLSSELMDHYILDRTKSNLQQAANRFFINGDPEAILIVEYEGVDETALRRKVTSVESDLRSRGLGYYFPLILGHDKKRVWDLRKAGLGLLSNVPHDSKPVSVIEDTAVDVHDLPAYIQEFNGILEKHKLYAVHYAHAATGELHLRPIINLKTAEGNQLFRQIALEIAHLVKKYRGSLSGEHGDGRLRGEFIPLMVGGHNYDLFKQLKNTWDPRGIFNPGKIVDTPPMNSGLRYRPEKVYREISTVFRYSDQTVLQHAEQCNGSGDCRKTHLSGGTMCPSYMVTKNEQDTTRARANILREMLTHSRKDNPFDHQEIREVMDLCLSCKACKSECPSSVDVTKLKAEFQQAYHDSHGIPLRTRLIAYNDRIVHVAQFFPRLFNWAVRQRYLSSIGKRVLGFAQQRTLPLIARHSLRAWYKAHRSKMEPTSENAPTVCFFFDEFTNYYDVTSGKHAILLLERLGYRVEARLHVASGRALLSKGMLRDAKKLANENVRRFRDLTESNVPLVGVEPSAILTFRDEYVDLVDESLVMDATRLAKRTFTIEEFIVQQYRLGVISANRFHQQSLRILVHGHCQQKAWGMAETIRQALSIPVNYQVQSIPSGCCGMAGSFGMEKTHYELSMQIGELVLFPTIRNKEPETVIAAPGTSCRQQILDGTKQRALHPVDILYRALI